MVFLGPGVVLILIGWATIRASHDDLARADR